MDTAAFPIDAYAQQPSFSAPPTRPQAQPTYAGDVGGGAGARRHVVAAHLHQQRAARLHAEAPNAGVNLQLPTTSAIVASTSLQSQRRKDSHSNNNHNSLQATRPLKSAPLTTPTTTGSAPELSLAATQIGSQRAKRLNPADSIGTANNRQQQQQQQHRTIAHLPSHQLQPVATSPARFSRRALHQQQQQFNGINQERNPFDYSQVLSQAMS